MPHPTLGEDVAAAVVLKPNGSRDRDRDRANSPATRLADFKVPRQIVIVDEIPKGPTGKLQRIGLADKLADMLAQKREANFVAAETSTEQQLVRLWKDLLRTEKVGVRDNFYALGGDSLAMAVMMAGVEERFSDRHSGRRFSQVSDNRNDRWLIRGSAVGRRLLARQGQTSR